MSTFVYGKEWQLLVMCNDFTGLTWQLTLSHSYYCALQYAEKQTL